MHVSVRRSPCTRLPRGRGCRTAPARHPILPNESRGRVCSIGSASPYRPRIIWSCASQLERAGAVERRSANIARNAVSASPYRPARTSARPRCSATSAGLTRRGVDAPDGFDLLQRERRVSLRSGTVGEAQSRRRVRAVDGKRTLERRDGFGTPTPRSRAPIAASNHAWLDGARFATCSASFEASSSRPSRSAIICRARSASSTVRRAACVTARRTHRSPSPASLRVKASFASASSASANVESCFERANPGSARFLGAIGRPRFEAFGVGGKRFDRSAAHFAQQAR